MSLDDKDRQLIRALKKNGRASLVSLAGLIDLSRSATHDRITRLEELGVIRGYTIVVDRSALPNARAFISLKFSGGKASSELAERIHRMDRVEAAYCLSGDLDMLVYSECETLDELNRLRDELAELDDVVEITTRTILAASVS
ncbi:MAG: Lrp/AsnC family transcriptional regulator [Myxococcota bacterium]